MEGVQSEAELVVVLHENLTKEFNGLDAKLLSKYDAVYWFHAPSLTRDLSNFPEEAFTFVGRTRFEEVYDFVTGLMTPKQEFSLPDAKRLKPSKDQQERLDQLLARRTLLQGTLTLGVLDKYLGCSAFVIGTPGEGKSYIIAVLAGLLHVTSSGFVTVYISAKRFIVTPYDVLRKALLLAFYGNKDVTEALNAITDLQSLRDWVATCKKLLFLVDNYNELDDNRRKGAAGTQAERDHAKTILDAFTLQHVVVFCSSCSSSCRLPLTREPHPPYLLICGGFSEEEYETYLLSEMARIPDETFKNPRLLRSYLRGELDEDLKDLEKDLQLFLEGLTGLEISDFMRQLAGGRGRRLPQAMDSRCFFPKDGTLVAISDYFLSAAYSMCVLLCQSATENTQEEHVGYFVAAVKNDKARNMSRIGWNVEEATLLVLGSQLVHIQLTGKQCWKFRAEQVKRFSGGIEAVKWDGTGRATLHLPIHFNCRSVDTVLEGLVEGRKVAAGLQVSVNKDPQGSHEGAIRKFCEMMRTCKVHYDILVFIWVGYFPGSYAAETIMVGNQKVIEVTMSFSHVHKFLRRLDLVLDQVRKLQVQERARVQCRVHKPGKAQCQNTLDVSVDPPVCHVHLSERQRKQVELDFVRQKLLNANQKRNVIDDLSKQEKALENALACL